MQSIGSQTKFVTTTKQQHVIIINIYHHLTTGCECMGMYEFVAVNENFQFASLSSLLCQACTTCSTFLLMIQKNVWKCLTEICYFADVLQILFKKKKNSYLSED